MSEATVTVREIQPAEGNRPWKLVDANGTDYATFKDEIIHPARELVGAQARIEFTEKQTEKNGRSYTNRYLEKVEPVTGNGEPPPLGTGDYVKAQTAPSDKQSIWASVALNNAVATLTPTIPATASTAEIQKRVTELANVYLYWLRAKNGAIQDEDIPF